MISVARLRRAARRETVGVDVGAALNLVGALLKYLSLAFVVPIGIALGYGESPWPFVAAGAITAVTSIGLQAVTHGRDTVGIREGFLVVSLTWLFAAAYGCLPFAFGTEQLSNPIDAYFEAMSGFTTTGASVLTDLTALDHSTAMWRQFIQWLGGMGIIVLALAVLPRLRVGGRQLFESEAPGPEVEQLSTTIRETARRLWILYVSLSALMLAALTVVAYTGLDEAMTFYDAVAHTFTTLPTGGFSPRARSFEEFGAASQWIAVFFMVVAGTNFALLYVAFAHRRVRRLFRDEEFRLYLLLLSLASAVLTYILLSNGIERGEGAVRHAIFQSVSVMTTTGYASTDSNLWPVLGLIVLIALMFIGASAGSTSGSVKVVRHLFIGRILRRELDQTVHPELVAPVRLNGRTVPERPVRAVIAFVLLYIGLFAVGAFLIALDAAIGGPEGIRVVDAISASAAMIGNVGPSTGIAGPMGSYAEFGYFSKLVMIGLMWMGRLEIIPVIVLLTKNYWRT